MSFRYLAGNACIPQSLRTKEHWTLIDSQQPLVVTPEPWLSPVTRHPSNGLWSEQMHRCMQCGMCAHARMLRKGIRLRGKGIFCILESDPRFALLLVSIVERTGCSRGGRSHPSHPSPELYPAHSARQLIDRERPESLTRHPDLNTSDNNDVDDG